MIKCLYACRLLEAAIIYQIRTCAIHQVETLARHCQYRTLRYSDGNLSGIQAYRVYLHSVCAREQYSPGVLNVY